MVDSTLLTQQRTLGVGLKDDATFANFFSEQNAELVIMLKKAVAGDGEKMIYLYGTGGLGCSHLSQACCHYANQLGLSAIYLPLANLLAYMPQMLEDLEKLSLVCVDDFQLIAGRRDWEESFLYFYNRLLAAGGCLVIAAKMSPKSLGLLLPDLASRLTAGIIYPLQPLTDEEKLAVLVRRAALRGITLAEEVARFMLTRCSRHMSALMALLEVLDRVSLASKRRPTIPFVKEVLEVYFNQERQCQPLK